MNTALLQRAPGAVIWPVQPSHTSRFERLLVAGALAILPLQNRVAPVGRLSIVWIAFAAIAIVALLRHPPRLFRVALHPVLVPTYCFLLIPFLLEFAHPAASWSYWTRIVQMVAGAIVLITVCRDRLALRAALHGLLIGASVLAALFVSLSYGPMRNTPASSFQEITQVREEAIGNSTLGRGVNSSGFLMGQGAGIATAFALTASRGRRRTLYTALVLLNLMAVFLSLSRGGIGTAVASIVAALFIYRKGGLKYALPITAVGVAFALLLPTQVLNRLAISPNPQRADPRVQIYQAAYRGLPDFAPFGVGAGNYKGDWGYANGFAEVNGFRRTDPTRFVDGAHNGFLQIWMNWGILALVAFVLALDGIRRRMVRPETDLEVAVWTRAVAAAVVTNMFVSHAVYGKEVSAAMAVILAPVIWGWYRQHQAPMPGPRPTPGDSPAD